MLALRKRPVSTEQVDAALLFDQTYIDQVRLAETIRAVLPRNTSALLSDVIAAHPIEQGAAEIVGYLAMNDEDVSIDIYEVGDEEDPDFDDGLESIMALIHFIRDNDDVTDRTLAKMVFDGMNDMWGED